VNAPTTLLLVLSLWPGASGPIRRQLLRSRAPAIETAFGPVTLAPNVEQAHSFSDQMCSELVNLGLGVSTGQGEEAPPPTGGGMPLIFHWSREDNNRAHGGRCHGPGEDANKVI